MTFENGTFTESNSNRFESRIHNLFLLPGMAKGGSAKNPLSSKK